jgi:hypothetical protein
MIHLFKKTTVYWWLPLIIIQTKECCFVMLRLLRQFELLVFFLQQLSPVCCHSDARRARAKRTGEAIYVERDEKLLLFSTLLFSDTFPLCCHSDVRRARAKRTGEAISNKLDEKLLSFSTLLFSDTFPLCCHSDVRRARAKRTGEAISNKLDEKLLSFSTLLFSDAIPLCSHSDGGGHERSELAKQSLLNVTKNYYRFPLFYSATPFRCVVIPT